jgi:hypothetical protein
VNAENAPAAIFSVQVLKEKDSIYTILFGSFPVTSSLGLEFIAMSIPNSTKIIQIRNISAIITIVTIPLTAWLTAIILPIIFDLKDILVKFFFLILFFIKVIKLLI